jgi:transcriptional regulator
MYIPNAFAVTDISVIRTFLEDNPFGMLTASMEWGRVEAAHVPFGIYGQGEYLELFTHFSVHGPLSSLQEGAEVLAVFTGAHDYISSSWYGHPNVPTWNYMAVHLRGRIYFQSPSELWNQLLMFTAHHEKNVHGQSNPEELPEALKEAYLKEIKGIRMEVSSAEAAFKLSQNRNRADFDRILAELDRRNPALAAYMREHYPGG